MNREWIPVLALIIIGGAIGAFMAHSEGVGTMLMCAFIGASSSVTTYATVRLLP